MPWGEAALTAPGLVGQRRRRAFDLQEQVWTRT